MSLRKYNISTLEKVYSKVATPRQLTFDEFSKLLKDASLVEFESKEQLGCFVGGELTEGKRSSEYLKCRSIITYDIDNYNSNLNNLVNYIEKSLSGKSYIYYTTASSTFENPRMRVLLFLSEDIPPSNYRNLVVDIANLLFSELLSIDKKRTKDERLCIDECSYKALYAMYLPSKLNDDFRYKENSGDLIDSSKYQKVNKANTIKYNSEDEEFKSFVKTAPTLVTKIDDATVERILSEYDATDATYSEWLNVGIGLHHNYRGSEKGLEFFTNWSLSDTNIESKGRYEGSNVRSVCKYKYETFRLDCESITTFASTIAAVNLKKKIPVKVTDSDVKYMKLVPVDLFPDLTIIEKKDSIVKKPKNTFENFNALCEFYGIQVAYDVITKQIVSSFTFDNLNDLDTTFVSLFERNGISDKHVTKYVNLAARKNIINSFKRVLDNVIWDGRDRLKEFCNTIEVDQEYEKTRDLYILKWIQQMLYLTLYEGKRKICRNIIVFQGCQFGGKSTWIMRLMPEHLSDYIGEGLTLDTNKDMILKAIGQHVIVELGELGQSQNKSSVDAMKAYFGRTKDILNEKYDKHPAKYQRTTSFIATVNDEIFLKDPTGSTRYLVIPVNKLNGYHDTDMLQLYKQIYTTTDYVDFELNEEQREEQRVVNERFEQPDIIDEIYNEHYQEPTYLGGSWVSAINILSQLGLKGDRMKIYRNEICRVLRKNKIKHRRKTNEYFVELKNNN